MKPDFHHWLIITQQFYLEQLICMYTIVIIVIIVDIISTAFNENTSIK